MPITIKTGSLKFKDPDTGKYVGIDVAAETKASQQLASIEAAGEAQVASITQNGEAQMADITENGESQMADITQNGQAQVAAIQTAGQTQVSNIETKGAETLDSIPDDYTDLYNDVGVLKSAINDITQTTRNLFDDSVLASAGLTLGADGFWYGEVTTWLNAFSSVLPIDGEYETGHRYTISGKYYFSNTGDNTYTVATLKENCSDNTSRNLVFLSSSATTSTEFSSATTSGKDVDHFSLFLNDYHGRNYTLHIKDLQIEKGSEKTDYTPHVTGYDSVVEKKVSGLEATISELSEMVGGYDERIEDVEEATEKVTNDFNMFANGFPFSFTSSSNLEYSFSTGDQCILDVASKTGDIAVFTANHTSDVYATITTTGKYEFTILHDGYLRFYLGANSAVAGTVYLKTRFDESENDEIQVAIPVMDSIAIKTMKVFDSFESIEGTFSFDGTATIETYRNFATTSTYCHNIPPVAIRDKNGILIYNNLRLYESVVSTSVAFWAFDKDGVFLRKVTYNALAQRTETFLSDEYYAILNQYYGYTKAYWVVSDVNIEWLNLGEETYTVGGSSANFSTFTAMLIALADNDRKKTVYVNPGEYDIFDEMGGADYIATIAPQASSLNWRDVCHVVPPNTTIIGLGNVVLKWLPTAAQMVDSATAFLFSPLNISGTCTVKNIKVKAQNCRYVVHDETSSLAEFNGAKHHYEDCVFTLLSGSYGGYVYGAGHNRLMEVTFDRCIFESQNSDGIWSTHDTYTPANEASRFSLNNCVFISNKTDPFIAFSSSDTNGRKDDVIISNCHIPKIRMTTGGSSAKQGYELTLIGCNVVPIEYSDLVTDRYEIKQYNSIGAVT